MAPLAASPLAVLSEAWAAVAEPLGLLVIPAQAVTQPVGVVMTAEVY